MEYNKTPEGIMDIIELFYNNDLDYILMKCDHIFIGKNKNLDILFKTKKGYQKASEIMVNQNFICQLPESIEKYKRMYCGIINNVMYSIHLHREVAWHGIKVLDKKPLFKNKKKLSTAIYVPSTEDSILIHAGHIIFENFKVTEKERKYFRLITKSNINLKYIKQQVINNSWKNGFDKVVINKQLTRYDIVLSWLEKLWKDPFTVLYLFRKIIKSIIRSLSYKKGYLISFIGVNGTGKSTISREILEEFKQSTQHLGKKTNYYYFGWKPRFILTKMLSKLFEKNKKQIFKKTALSKKIKKFDLKQEILLIYLFIEYYYRYLMDIKPNLKKNKLVVTDRYFYDIFGQYPYAKNSKIIKILIKIFPKPNVTYLLDAEIKELIKRKKTTPLKT